MASIRALASAVRQFYRFSWKGKALSSRNAAKGDAQ